MKRIAPAVIFTALTTLFFLAPGCGSRPGFEEDFAHMEQPDAPEAGLTDEQIEELHAEQRRERLQKLKELRKEEFDLYVRSDEQLDPLESPEPYTLSAGDKIRVRFTPQSEMTALFVVRPDGMVSFDLIGEIPVVGLTPLELGETLEELYAVYLRSPSINVSVEEFASQRIYVLGEVVRPGMYPLINTTTLTQVIGQAGGWRGTARMEDVMIIRKGEDQMPFAFRVNVKDMLKNDEMHSDIAIRNLDIVYVPKGKLASAADFTGRFFDIVLPPIDAGWKLFLMNDYARRF